MEPNQQFASIRHLQMWTDPIKVSKVNEMQTVAELLLKSTNLCIGLGHLSSRSLLTSPTR